MGFLYNAMDSAKEKIAHTLGGQEKDYKEIWDIIDVKWESQLHRHLHVAAYFLNPHCHYAPGISSHPEIKLGLFRCMDKLIPNPKDKEKADLLLEWWIQFGDGTPELQKFAIKVLGLTCSSSGCERNWSTFNQVHTKRRNRLPTLRMNSLVYIMYNKRLNDRHLKLKSQSNEDDALLIDEMPSDDEDLGVDLRGWGLTQLNQNNRTAPKSSSRAGKRKRVLGLDEDVWEGIDGDNEDGDDERKRVLMVITISRKIL
ncbi:uncharacterized protein LOC133785996 [Humulus lupulus]|uniref:uncharacterized protein LOC133785996 n=1 Tax=Humulus lupulus TaxID=3486 RepID=UPI002B40BA8E|nr:uncharacterized protein LOC133785996 [Humulus lupulus]